MLKWKIRTSVITNAKEFANRVELISKNGERHAAKSLMRLGNGMNEGLYGIPLSSFDQDSCRKVISSYGRMVVRHEKLIWGLLARLQVSFNSYNMISVLSSLHAIRIEPPVGWVSKQNLKQLTKEQPYLLLQLLSQPHIDGQKYFNVKMLLDTISVVFTTKVNGVIISNMKEAKVNLWHLCAMYASLLPISGNTKDALRLLHLCIRQRPADDWQAIPKILPSGDEYVEKQSLVHLSVTLYAIGVVCSLHQKSELMKRRVDEFLMTIGHHLAGQQSSSCCKLMLKPIAHFFIAIANAGMKHNTLTGSQQRYLQYLPPDWAIFLSSPDAVMSWENVLLTLLGTVKRNIPDKELTLIRTIKNLRPDQVIRRGHVINIIMSLATIEWPYKEDYVNLFRAAWSNHYEATKLPMADVTKLAWSLIQLFKQFGKRSYSLIGSFCKNVAPSLVSLLTGKRTRCKKVLDLNDASLLLECYTIYCRIHQSPASVAIRDRLQVFCQNVRTPLERPPLRGDPPREFRPY
eukprot:TRINITY_DN13294_c0_g1_i1.p1 TRINITY_DN13294_c0_g1~~TRINITY_DN13294_c0_g1_i1.p1  ORF type:complete len:517 (+),score=43.18 TRINITY_DN13294_c0_g1_i1:183-1733(+)